MQCTWVFGFTSTSVFPRFFSFFFFFSHSGLFNKNISHNTIHTFKNYLLQYFQFWIFTFQFSAKISCIQMDTVVANAAWCFNLPFSPTSQIHSCRKNFGTFPLNTKCLTFVGINGESVSWSGLVWSKSMARICQHHLKENN